MSSPFVDTLFVPQPCAGVLLGQSKTTGQAVSVRISHIEHHPPSEQHFAITDPQGRRYLVHVPLVQLYTYQKAAGKAKTAVASAVFEGALGQGQNICSELDCTTNPILTQALNPKLLGTINPLAEIRQVPGATPATPLTF
jgi:hypothetical protein